jgi:imidazole glycerol-phosphate synthase subunit HisH
VIVIIDYGVGNVGSVLNMLRKVGAQARVSGDAADMRAADKLVLPGIGHFGHGIRTLAATGLLPILEEQALHERKPTLGICLGMQMMTRGSEESDVPGLGWIDASTHRLPQIPGLRVPHMGWNRVQPVAGARLFEHGAHESERFYFVHSYYVATADSDAAAATCRYGVEFVASFERGNLFGVQFHPEKSHMFGMALLRRFAAL